jgi:hypothetical protein
MNTAYAPQTTSSKPRLRRYPFLGIAALQLLLIALLFSSSSFVRAEPEANIPQQELQWQQLASLIEEEKQPFFHLQKTTRKPRNSWAVAFDNDVLVPGHRDQDYTYGLNFTQTGLAAQSASFSLNKPLVFLDGLLDINPQEVSILENFSREIGAFGFTPEDKILTTANPLDRPYASLIYLSSSREQVDLVSNTAWKTTLTLGALGLGLVGDLQNLAHKITQGTEAEGWNNQISEGGELTGRYVIARQKVVGTATDSFELKSTWQVSLGYLTETTWGLSLRTGRIHSLWSSFNPELASYGEKSSLASSPSTLNEGYFWAGFALKARAYNVFLQGQVRDSVVSYQTSELNPLLVEAWAGYTLAFKQGYRISYVLRGHSSEINTGAGDRNLLWGGIIVAKTI